MSYPSPAQAEKNAQAYMRNLLGAYSASSSDEETLTAPALAPGVVGAVTTTPTPSFRASSPLMVISNSPPPPTHSRRINSSSGTSSGAMALNDKRRRIREGKNVASEHRETTQAPSRLEKVKKRLGLSSKKRNVVRSPTPSPSPSPIPSPTPSPPREVSPPIPSDPEDEDFHFVRPESSQDTSLYSDVEFEREMYESHGRTLQELHFFSPDERSEEEEEEYVPPTPNSSRTPPARHSTSRAPSVQRDPESRTPPPTAPVEREPMTDYDILKALSFGPSKYPDFVTLTSFGIASDVERIFRAAGVYKFMTLQERTYPEEAAQFLASLSFVALKDAKSVRRNGGGFIRFRVHGQKYKRSFHDIREVFDFPGGQPIPHRFDAEELHKVWFHLTGLPRLTGANSKGNKIRNPALSFARRAFAELFLAKHKAGPASLQDMRFLTSALKNLFPCFPDGQYIIGDTADSDLTYQWVSHLVTTRNRLISTFTSVHTKGINFGGPITALLKNFGVPLNEEGRCEPRLMDEDYLRKANFLDKRYYGDVPVYPFSHRVLGSTFIPLPNTITTYLDDFDKVEFNPPIDLLVHPSQLNARPRAPRPRPARPAQAPRRPAPVRRAEAPARQAEEPVWQAEALAPRSPVQDPPSPVNIEDYQEAPGTYDEYHAPTSPPHLYAAHNKINMLQKPVKWVVKQFKGLVKNLKEEKVEREQRWAAEREAMERRWEEERESLRKDLEDQRALVTSLSGRFEGYTTGGVRPGRHSVSEGVPMDISPAAREPRRHSTMSTEATPNLPDDDRDDGALLRRPRRRLALDHTEPAPYSQDVPMADAQPRRQRHGKEHRTRRERPESSRRRNQAGPSAPPTDQAEPRLVDHDNFLGFSEDFVEEQRRLYNDFQGNHNNF